MMVMVLDYWCQKDFMLYLDKNNYTHTQQQHTQTKM